MKLQWKLLFIVTLFIGIAIVASNYILGVSLVKKDMIEAKRVARQTAAIMKSGIINTMIGSGDHDKISRVVEEMMRYDDFHFRMVRSKYVVKQHGIKRGEVPKDALEEKALETGEIIESQDSKNILRIIYPFITDERCGACHVGLDGNPLPSGVVNGLAIITFDLSKLQSESRTVATHLMISLSAMLILSATLIILFSHGAVTKPVTQIATAIIGLREDRLYTDLPNYSTYEIKIMAEEVKTTAEMLRARKKQSEIEIETERERNLEIRKFVQARAASMGLGYDAGVGQVIDKLSNAIDEAKKADMMGQVFKYVIHGKSSFELPSDPSIIPAVSIYLGELADSSSETVKKRSIELALDEAISNAIYHGNLDMQSNLKEEDFDAFTNIAMERSTKEPYASRKVRVEYDFSRQRARFTIKDEGHGFDWRSAMEEGSQADPFKSHGRGMMILRALASEITFNEEGNQITLAFDMESKNQVI